MRVEEMTADQKSRLCDIADIVIDYLEELKQLPVSWLVSLSLIIVIKSLRKAHEKICGKS
jgi:hypothetical protein